MIDFYVPISVYSSARGSRFGRTMSLAEFFNLGKEHASIIMAYRTLKSSLRELKDEEARKREQLESFKATLTMGYNPLDPDAQREYVDIQQLCEVLTQELAQLNADIKRGADEADRLKRGLPAATLSGSFEPTRAERNLVRHSGFICIDIDDHFNRKDSQGQNICYTQSLESVPSVLASMPWVCYAAHSVGGIGYYALIPLGPIDDVHTHKWYFECLEQEFLQYGFVIDPACSDVTRLRILSYDKSPYRNAHAVAYMGRSNFVGRAERERLADEQRRQVLAAAHRDRLHQNPDDSLRDADICVTQIERLALDITESYDQCIKLGRSLLSLGDSGLYLWQRLCRYRSASHSQLRTDGELERKWHTLSRTGAIDIGFFFNECKKHGIYARNN